MGRVRRPARGPVVDVAAAPIVLTGVSTDSRSFARGGAVVTDTTVEVKTVERGRVSGSVVIRSAGGTLPSGLTQHTEHQPVLDPGVRSRLFLRPTTGGVYVVVGDAQGQIIVGGDQTASVATTCPDGGTPGEGWCWDIDNFGNNPRWARSAMPVKYRTNANTSDVAGEGLAVRAGFGNRALNSGSSMDWKHVGSTNVTAVANDGVNAVFWSSNASNFVAYATYWTNSRGKILGFDVEYNDSYTFSVGAEEGSP